MWFKKKSVLQAEGHYNTEKSADGSTDMRTTYKTYGNSNSSSINNSGLPSAADANKYFYLPSLGYYYNGRPLIGAATGFYWSSSADPRHSYNAYFLRFYSGGVEVSEAYSRNGFCVGTFE